MLPAAEEDRDERVPLREREKIFIELEVFDHAIAKKTLLGPAPPS